MNRIQIIICQIAEGKILREKWFEAEYLKTKTAPNWPNIVSVSKSTIQCFYMSVIYVFNFLIIEIPIKIEDSTMFSMLVYSNQNYFCIIIFYIWPDNCRNNFVWTWVLRNEFGNSHLLYLVDIIWLENRSPAGSLYPKFRLYSRSNFCPSFLQCKLIKSSRMRNS